jgi:hypothetical protein
MFINDLLQGGSVPGGTLSAGKVVDVGNGQWEMRFIYTLDKPSSYVDLAMHIAMAVNKLVPLPDLARMAQAIKNQLELAAFAELKKPTATLEQRIEAAKSGELIPVTKEELRLIAEKQRHNPAWPDVAPVCSLCGQRH